MEKIVYIGGVGSSHRQVDDVARVLTTKYNRNVVGLSFSEAQRQRAYVARLVPDSLVITHSAGLILLRDMTPKEVIAIAPPMPTPSFVLFIRSLPKTLALIRSASESRDRWRKVIDYHLQSFGEHLSRPHLNSFKVRLIGMFDSATTAVALQNTGAKVTLVFMENDVLFPDASLHPHIDLAKSYGVTVYDNVLGHHDEFVLYPIEVLAQCDR